MLALGFSTRYAGLDSTMGFAFASTGVLFPFFSPLTGSDTSSNVLFRGLQRISAERLGLSPILACAPKSLKKPSSPRGRAPDLAERLTRSAGFLVFG